MNNEYKERLDSINAEDMTQENTAKSILATGEDTHKILNRVENIEDILVAQNGIQEEKKSKRKTVDSMQISGVRFRVVEYDSSYVGDLSVATDIYHAQKMGMKLRSLEVDLNKGAVTMESGMYQSSEGQIQLKQKFSPMHMLGGIVRKMNDETFFRPEFGGTGTVRLESNFKFIQLIHVPKQTRLVLEKGIYLASSGEFEYKTAKNFNVGMMLFSEKSILQTELKGTGLVALELPVHPTELVKHVVTPDRPFQVSGEYVLYWTGNLKRTINPARKLLGNMASGRGIVEEYTGEGYVYTAPTLGFYNQIADGMRGKNTAKNNPIREDSDLGKERKSLRDLVGLRSNKSLAISIIVGIIIFILFIKIIF